MKQCLKLTEEFRQLSDRHTNHEDKLQVIHIQSIGWFEFYCVLQFVQELPINFFTLYGATCIKQST